MIRDFVRGRTHKKAWTNSHTGQRTGKEEPNDSESDGFSSEASVRPPRTNAKTTSRVLAGFADGKPASWILERLGSVEIRRERVLKARLAAREESRKSRAMRLCRRLESMRVRGRQRIPVEIWRAAHTVRAIWQLRACTSAELEEDSWAEEDELILKQEPVDLPGKSEPRFHEVKLEEPVVKEELTSERGNKGGHADIEPERDIELEQVVSKS